MNPPALSVTCSKAPVPAEAAKFASPLAREMPPITLNECAPPAEHKLKNAGRMFNRAAVQLVITVSGWRRGNITFHRPLVRKCNCGNDFYNCQENWSKLNVLNCSCSRE